MRRWRKRAAIAVAVVAVLAAAGFAYYRHRYPHGWSHCCDKQLMMALLTYDDRHDGWGTSCRRACWRSWRARPNHRLWQTDEAGCASRSAGAWWRGG
jgi:hypothetical protein